MPLKNRFANMIVSQPLEKAAAVLGRMAIDNLRDTVGIIHLPTRVYIDAFANERVGIRGVQYRIFAIAHGAYVRRDQLCFRAAVEPRQVLDWIDAITDLDKTDRIDRMAYQSLTQFPLKPAICDGAATPTGIVVFLGEPRELLIAEEGYRPFSEYVATNLKRKEARR